MPSAPGCSASSVAGPPRRFRAVGEEEHPDSAQASGKQLVGLPPPRHPVARPIQRSRSVGSVSSVASERHERSWPARGALSAGDTARHGCADAHKSSSGNSSRLVRAASSPALSAEPTPAVGAAGPKLSVTELVNLAAKAAELEEKSHSSRLSDPSAGLVKQDLRSSYAGLLAATSQHSPRSRVTSSSSGPRGTSQPQQAAPNQASSSRTATPRPLNGSSSMNHAGDGAAAGSPTSSSGNPSSSSHRASGRPPMSAARSSAAGAAASSFNDPRFQQQQAHHQHPPSLAAGLGGHHQHTSSSECGSEDGAFPSAASSLVSSASCSSLCSAASYGSNASTCSTSSTRKGILLRRSSTGSSSSGASSPRCAKRVTWRDGQAGCEQELGGAALVAVRLMEDSPEVRRMRRDTWPENPGARREALEVAAAAAAAAKQQQQSSLSRAIELLQEPAKLFDWRDKLKQLQQERRQQRLGIVCAGWQQQQLAAAAEGDEDGGEQQAAAVPMETTAAAGGDACNKACGAAAVHINAVAASATAASF